MRGVGGPLFFLNRWIPYKQGLYSLHTQKLEMLRFFIHCIAYGKYSLWTSWTQCDRTCGNGTKIRSRSCSHPAPAFSGLTCIQQNLGESEEAMFCKLQNCPGEDVMCTKY